MDTQADDDIYSDLPSFKYHETLDKLQASNKALQTKVRELEEQIEKLNREKSEYQVKANTMTTSFSSLLKTCQAEVKRKDKRINELNREIITFKTRSFKVRQKRILPHSFNENSNENSKKARLSDSEKSPHKKALDAAYRVKLNASLNSPATYKNSSYNSPASNNVTSYKSPASSKVTIETKVVAKPRTLVPNIKCHTLYSQRMFKKIYNADPVIQTVNPPEPNEDVQTKPLSPKPCEEDNTKPATLENNEITALSLHEILPDASERKSNVNENSETNNNLELTSIKEAKDPFQDENILDDSSKTKKDDIPSKTKKDDSGNANKDDLTSVSQSTCAPFNLQDLSKDIQVKELRSIISNVLCLNKAKEAQSSHPNDEVPFPLKSNTLVKKTSCRQVRDVIKNKNNIQKPLTRKSDKNSENLISSTFGSKLLNRQSKTTFRPISGQWNDILPKKEVVVDMKPESISPHNKNDIMEALFGSPLKWTENSTDEKLPPKLTPPSTAYEDSCSAQIENSKFLKLNSIESDVKHIKNPKEITLNKSDLLHVNLGNNIHTPVSLKKGSIYSGFQKLEDIPPRPFEQIKDTKSNITSFSAFVNLGTGATQNQNSPSLPKTIEQAASQSTKNAGTIVMCPKYNDSILGQFDDTTQLISALARDHSKISPIHTPIKENKSEIISSSPDNKSNPKIENSIKKSECHLSVTIHNTVTKKPEKKIILLDKPINILRPRKTPRIVSQKKTTPLKNETNCNSNKNEVSANSHKEGKEIPCPSKQQETEGPSKHITASVKVSSVSNEVIKRVRAIEKCESYLMYKYEDRKLKYKEKKNNKDRKNSNSSKEALDVSNKSLSDDRSKAKSELEECSSKYTRESNPNKKENSPIISRRDEKHHSNLKTHFKRPISHISRHRHNCRFRHSSVERKLIKDNRHSNRIRSTPVREVKKQDLRREISSGLQKRRNSQNSTHSQSFIPSVVSGYQKICRESSTFSGNVEDSHAKLTSSSILVSSQPVNSPFSPTHDSCIQRTTHIRRASKTIDWSSTTSDVVSTYSIDNTPTSPKIESKMKWFLQPIEFCATLSRNKSKISEASTKINSEEVLLRGDCEKRKVFRHKPSTNVSNNDQEKASTKSPNIVIIPRKRPVKFGVSEMSAQCCLKTQES